MATSHGSAPIAVQRVTPARTGTSAAITTAATCRQAARQSPRFATIACARPTSATASTQPPSMPALTGSGQRARRDHAAADRGEHGQDQVGPAARDPVASACRPGRQRGGAVGAGLAARPAALLDPAPSAAAAIAARRSAGRGLRRRARARARSSVPGWSGTWRHYGPASFENRLSYRHLCARRSCRRKQRRYSRAGSAEVGRGTGMRHIAIIGSGPAGYYTAEAAQKAFGDEVRVDVFDRLPVPLRADPQRRRARSPVDQGAFRGATRRSRCRTTCASSATSRSASDVSIAELQELYDAVVLATGAPKDRAARHSGRAISATCSAAPRSSAGTTAIPSSPGSIPTCRARPRS